MGPAGLHIDLRGHMSHIQFHTTADTRSPCLYHPVGSCRVTVGVTTWRARWWPWYEAHPHEGESPKGVIPYTNIKVGK